MESEGWFLANRDLPLGGLLDKYPSVYSTKILFRTKALALSFEVGGLGPNRHLPIVLLAVITVGTKAI